MQIESDTKEARTRTQTDSTEETATKLVQAQLRNEMKLRGLSGLVVGVVRFAVAETETETETATENGEC